MKKAILLFVILSFSFCVQAQSIRSFSATQLIKYTSAKDTLYIINFWATWCLPCVQELPEFNALNRRYLNRNVKVILVSMDFKEDYPYKLARFIERKGLTPEVVWLSDTNPNEFIPKIDSRWEGSIPATIIVHPGKGYKKFIEGQVDERQISSIVDKMLAAPAEDE